MEKPSKYENNAESRQNVGDTSSSTSSTDRENDEFEHIFNSPNASVDKENAIEESRNGSALSTSPSMSSESDDTERETSSESSEESTSSEDEETSTCSDDYEIETFRIVVEEEKQKRHKFRKRFTLPFFFNYMAWILCVGTIVISIFYLWAYGVMFGNDKTYQWLTSSIAYFWSDMLIVEPMKVTTNYKENY